MARRLYIKDLVREGERFDEVFLLAEKELKAARTGKMFIRGSLQDRTGQATMMIWEATEKFYEALPRGGFVRTKGRVELYQGRPQLVIEACIPVDEKDVTISEFLPATQHDIGQMEAELREIMATMAEGPVRSLAQAFLDDKELMAAFRRSPAAKTFHHAYIGGLLEHTLGIMRVAQKILPLYPLLNGDLLLLGVFLHDIGKTAELSCDREFAYTDAGQLVGHLVMGVGMVQDKVRQLRAGGCDVPDAVVQQVEHMILAHHGQYEFGSPKLPMTAEALALHFLDNLDAKLVAFAQAVDNHPVDGDAWTSRQYMFDNQMLFRGAADDRKRSSVPESANEQDNGAGDARPPRKGGLE
ncbi:MAG: HD domain-containing protein [Phycisphaerae bacterium]|nr:HD domain-containing protein [Phycisphaerae bacterium]